MTAAANSLPMLALREVQGLVVEVRALAQEIQAITEQPNEADLDQDLDKVESLAEMLLVKQALASEWLEALLEHAEHVDNAAH